MGELVQPWQAALAMAYVLFWPCLAGLAVWAFTEREEPPAGKLAWREKLA